MWRLTDAQQELREHIRTVVLEEIRPRTLDFGDEYPHEVFEILRREQLVGLGIPPEYGGRGDQSNVSYCTYIEELAKVSATVSLMAAYVKLVALPILLAGSEDQKARWLPPLAAGEIHGCYALTEPGVGSDPAALTTRAERIDGGWRLTGEKRFIGNAGMAAIYVVFARTGEEDSHGISAFLVPGDAPGLTVEPLPTMGMVGWQLGAPKLDGVEVSDDALLGREGDGFKLAMMTFDRSRPGVAAQAVGVGQGATDLALEYALRRHAFGRPLMGHEGIQFKLAGMEADVAAARALTYQAATAVDEDDPNLTKLASAAKLVASDTAMRATTEAVQILGGNGYLREFPAERMMRDAKVLQIYEGANEIQRLVVARQLAKTGAERDPIWPETLPGVGDVASGEAAEANAPA
ncbi:MAG: acyl-CoA dehydrogenase family protein [Solirubrobacteraceae bacterium]